MSFLKRLTGVMGAVKVVVTMRSEYLWDCGKYEAIRTIIQDNLVVVPPLDAKQLRDVMERQSSVVRLQLEGELGGMFLDDLKTEPGAMPLLEHAWGSCGNVVMAVG